MSTVHRWVAPGNITTDISSRVETADEDTEPWSVTTQAEEGSNGTSTVTIDDPDGDFEVPYMNNYRVHETLSEAADPYIFAGAFRNARIVRGPYSVGASRQHVADVVDANVLLEGYVFRPDEDTDRPEEDHSDRMTWLLGTTAMANIDDTSLVDTSATVTMSETDYAGQSPADVLRDLIRQSGYDMFVYFFGETEVYGLVYQPPGADYLTSDIRISNILSDIEGDATGNTFGWSKDAELEVATERIASHVLGRGDGIEVFRQLTPTAVTYGRRDMVMDEPNVRSTTILNDRMDRMLQTLSEPEYIPSGYIEVPRSKASQVRAGMRVQFRASHWPGYEEWTWGRILKATHIELPGRGGLVPEGGYRIHVELDIGLPAAAAPGDCAAEATPSGTYPPLNGEITDADGVVYYGSVGDPTPEVPTPGHTGGWPFPDYGTGGSPDYAGDCATAKIVLIVVGAGTISVETAQYTQPRNLTATLLHRHTGDPDPTLDETQTGVAGDTFDFTVSTHGGTECIHWVDVRESEGGSCGDKFGFAGATWVSAE